jgi:predicted alpha/beta-fold hydrolase
MSSPVRLIPVSEGEPGLYCNPSSPLASRVFERCKSYAPPPVWGRNGHLQTILASLNRRTRAVEYARELLRTDDGGTLALDLFIRAFPEQLPKGEGSTVVPLDERARAQVNERPFLLLTAGLGGGSQDTYVRSMAVAASAAGWHVAVLNMRGCGGSPITSPRFFSAHRGSTDDVRTAVRHIRSSAHLALHAPVVAAVGWSNGGTIINNALAEQHSTHKLLAGERSHLIDAGVTLATPLNMPAADRNLGRPFHRAVYDRAIAKGLTSNFETSNARALFEAAQRDGGTVRAWDGSQMRIDVDRLLSSRTIRQIDELLTSRCFGFESVDAYYADASSDQRLPAVRVPLLLVNSYDDPLAPGWTLPYGAARRSEHVMLALTEHGGHLGWCDEREPFGEPVWAEQTVCAFLGAALDLSL